MATVHYVRRNTLCSRQNLLYGSAASAPHHTTLDFLLVPDDRHFFYVPGNSRASGRIFDPMRSPEVFWSIAAIDKPVTNCSVWIQA